MNDALLLFFGVFIAAIPVMIIGLVASWKERQADKVNK
jgi:hypothetical protein